jgi:hypothetical protein
MITKKHMLIVCFAVCALSLAALGAPMKSVERPFKIDGHMTVTIDRSTCVGVFCSAVYEDWGEATHVGRYSNSANLTYNALTGILTGTGTLTAANGDQLFWEKDDHAYTIIGGTGRFEGAEGEFEITHPPAVITYDGPLVIATHTYKGSGTITY